MMKCTDTASTRSLMKATTKDNGSWASTRVSAQRHSLWDPPTMGNTEKDHEADGASVDTTMATTMKANGKKASEKDVECNKYIHSQSIHAQEERL